MNRSMTSHPPRLVPLIAGALLIRLVSIISTYICDSMAGLASAEAHSKKAQPKTAKRSLVERMLRLLLLFLSCFAKSFAIVRGSGPAPMSFRASL